MAKSEDREFEEILNKYLEHPEVKKMSEYCAHGNVSVLKHSIAVARCAYDLNRKLKVNADLDTLLVGALLHDFYLYDWHDASIRVPLFKMHGFTHPEKARENAVRYFDVDDRVQEVIRCHMWPLTLRSVPKHKEAMLVCMADKMVALKETIQDR